MQAPPFPCAHPSIPPAPFPQVLGANYTIVRHAEGGAEPVVLEKGQGTLLAPGSSFAILEQEEATTCRIAAVEAPPPPPAAAAHQPVAKRSYEEAAAAARTLSMSDPQLAAADKRPRLASGDRGAAAAAAVTAALSTAAVAAAAAATAAAAAEGPAGDGGEAWLHEDCPIKLLWVRDLPARHNTGNLGARWGQLVSGPIRTAVVVSGFAARGAGEAGSASNDARAPAQTPDLPAPLRPSDGSKTLLPPPCPMLTPPPCPMLTPPPRPIPLDTIST